MKRTRRGPQFVRFFWPVVAAIQSLGGSARPDEVCAHIAKALNVSEEEQAEPLASGESRFENQVQWARFYLARAGFIDSSKRGVWTLTEKSRSLMSLSHDEAMDVFRSVQSKFRSSPTEVKDVGDDVELNDTKSVPSDDSATVIADYRQELLNLLRSIPPDGFERFCQLLLRESGFEEVSVTGKSGDGGIDGIGILQVNSLVSFKVLFQCKRYAGSVSASVIRDFRGAMMGRADKGIILTTGSFTAEAKREAIRDGAPPIELVDGEKIVRMLEDLELGLIPRKTFSVDLKFFEEFARK